MSHSKQELMRSNKTVQERVRRVGNGARASAKGGYSGASQAVKVVKRLAPRPGIEPGSHAIVVKSAYNSRYTNRDSC